MRHLEKLHAWLDRQEHIKVLRVSYKDLIERPELMASRVAEFLGGQGDVQAMAAAVDPALYRNRKSGESTRE